MGGHYSTSPRTAAGVAAKVYGEERVGTIHGEKATNNLLEGVRNGGGNSPRETALFKFGSEWINMIGVSGKERYRTTCAREEIRRVGFSGYVQSAVVNRRGRKRGEPSEVAEIGSARGLYEREGCMRPVSHKYTRFVGSDKRDQ